MFGELTYALADQQRVIGGLRSDRYDADRYSSTTGAYMAGADENLDGGFVRYENDLSTAAPPTSASAAASAPWTTGKRPPTTA